MGEGSIKEIALPGSTDSPDAIERLKSKIKKKKINILKKETRVYGVYIGIRIATKAGPTLVYSSIDYPISLCAPQYTSIPTSSLVILT